MYIYRYVTTGSSFHVDNVDAVYFNGLLHLELDPFRLGKRLLYVS
jgi:hypothetical protein